MSTYLYIYLDIYIKIVLLTVYKAKIKQLIKCQMLPQNNRVYLIYKYEFVHYV